MVIVCLIEKHIFPVLYSLVVGGVLFKDAGGIDAVFSAELLPELGTDWVRG
jgi:hypothetical protein